MTVQPCPRQGRSWLWGLVQYDELWDGVSTYMRRWRLGPRGLPGLRVHCIMRSDDARVLHDHPFDFVSIILRGGYWEWLRRANGSADRTWHGPGSVLWRRATAFHRLEVPAGGSCWTFVFRGPYRRRWGFERP